MTFDDDFIQLNTPLGALRLFLQSQGIEWPPPDLVNYEGKVYHKIRQSGLSDDERLFCPMMMRGAEYRMLENVMPQELTTKIH